MLETIKSQKYLVKEGFKVMVYCSDDPLLAKELEDRSFSNNAISFTYRFRTRNAKIKLNFDNY